ncbi:MAG: hypothetical protein CFE21_14760 [Bacteroidetes bacterium B1(2017)]|nr:MAG: hypothetical protein CFE21_14760 [Bacteroidetes bacterium B1(2017)]
MKKVLLTALAALSIGTAAMAQKIDNSKDRRFQSVGEASNPFKTKSLHKAGQAVSDWYSIMDMIDQSNVGSSLTPFVNFMVHDSLNKFIESDGTVRYGGWQSVGQVIDPKDDLINLTTSPQNQLSRFNSYKCDSIAFQYLYVRNVDSISDGMGGKAKVVDTLFVAFFSGAQIKKLSFTSSGDKLALVDWDYTKRLPANYVSIQTILLNRGDNGIFDTTVCNNSNGGFENGWITKIGQIPAPAGMAITANSNGSTTNNLVGMSYTFKSGVPTIVGTDTAVMVYQKDPITTPAGMRRTNYFGCRFQQNSGTTGWANQSFFNTSLFALKNTSYKDDGNPNSWKGYVSGNAFTNDLFLESWFHLSTTGSILAGVNETDNVSITSVYPNPSKGFVKANFETKTSSDVKVEIVNLIGQTVKTINFGKTAAGTYELPMDLTSLNPGVYMISITAGNSTHTQKLVIAE